MNSSSFSSQLGLKDKGEGSSSNGNSNGTGASHRNGSNVSSANGHTNGHAIVDIPTIDEAFKPLYEGSRLDRTEYIRITLQSLKELGFESSAKALEAESGVMLEHTSIVGFRKAVMAGDWKNAERLLVDGLKYAATRMTASTHPMAVDLDVVLRDPQSRGLDSIKFLLHQQRYLELLESRQTRKALSVLRKRLAPLNHGSERLHQLSSLVMCASPEEMRSRAKWEGTGIASRRNLLQEIESAVSPLVMIPSRRLPQLLEQAQQLQKTMDPFFNLPLDAQMSLYVDHRSDRSVFPTQTAAILTAHTDEIWFVAFSHDGKRLASVGRDREAIIWSVGIVQEDFKVLHRFGPHTGSICHAAWSPDDSKLLTTTSDGEVNVWNVKSGTKKEYREHVYTVGSGAWLPNGEQFITGGMDGKIIIWNVDGTKRHTWLVNPYRVQAIAVSPDGRHLIAISIRAVPNGGGPSSSDTAAAAAANSAATSANATYASTGQGVPTRAWGRTDTARRTEGDWTLEGFGSRRSADAHNGNSSHHHVEEGIEDLGGGSRVQGEEKQRIQFYDLEKNQEVGSIYVWDELTSVLFSDDSKQVLFNQRPNESQIWDVSSQSLVMRLNGHKVQQHVIRNCFGGVERAFVISGSEDSIIYVYHRKTGKLLDKLKGHGVGSVNSVAWHPTQHSMFASCSDDGTIRIWRPKLGGHSTLAANETSKSLTSNGGNSTTGNGLDREHSALTEPSPFPWSQSPRAPGSPSPLTTIGPEMGEGSLRSTGRLTSSVPNARSTDQRQRRDQEEDEEDGEEAGQEDDGEDDDDDDEEEEDDDDDAMAM
ncbi:hypothetical protein CBS101457_004668 [Exobasidium rhododendri]|nr:hypothetical protein CBS101457_004668 [Exobasidium rhododendri]